MRPLGERSGRKETPHTTMQPTVKLSSRHFQSQSNSDAAVYAHDPGDGEPTSTSQVVCRPRYKVDTSALADLFTER